MIITSREREVNMIRMSESLCLGSKSAALRSLTSSDGRKSIW